jgi:predicted short-subunit dehydrogenase-like oxidoreductase (DUF2520 family)
MKVVIIGSGNVATVLGRKLSETGHQIIQIVGRTETNTRQAAASFASSYTTDISTINTMADLYILAVTDSSIAPTADQLFLTDKIVVHTAGSVSKEILQKCSDNYGVIYPIQTLKKELVDIPPIPVLIDASNGATEAILKSFCATWATEVIIASDEARLKIHVAAVIVNNFVNHLLLLTEKYCIQEKLEFGALYPLLEETIRKVKFKSRAVVQTGPAIRNDFETIDKHVQILKNYPELQSVYQLFSESIINLNARKNTN